MSKSPLQLALDAAKTQVKLASIVGVTQQAISQRLRAGTPIPAEWVVPIEQQLGIPRHKLRPDLFQPPAKAA